MKLTAALVCLGLVSTPAFAGDAVIGIGLGLNVFNDSGVSTIDRLERNELASSNVKRFFAGYEAALLGGTYRITGGLEHTDVDGDWGVYQSNGDLARQTVQIASTRVYVGLDYDIKQVKIGALYPFVGVGAGLALNRPENSTLIELNTGGESGCLSDNSDTTSLTYHGRAGLGYDIGKSTRLSLFYQFTDHGKAKTSCDNGPAGYEDYTVHIKSHSVNLGLIVRF